MSLIETKIITELGADADVTAEVGQKVYLDEAPQGTDPPFIVFRVISGGPQVDAAGADNIGINRVQIDCWAEEPYAAALLDQKVRAAINGASSLKLGGVTRIPDVFEPQLKLYRVGHDYSLGHDESA